MLMYSKNKICFFICVAFLLPSILFAQKTTSFFKGATKAQRDSFYNRTLRTINKTLTLPLDSTTEENWQGAFYNIALLNYKNNKVNTAIKKVSKSIVSQSYDCKVGFLNLVNNFYPKSYFFSKLFIKFSD